MARNIVKGIYILLLFLINKMFKHKIDSHNVVVFMTFKEDVLPVIEALKEEKYHITIIAHPKWIDFAHELQVDKVINLKNKYIIQQIKAIKSSKTVIIDTYYLLLGGITKANNQTVIQTWHAAGATKQFGLEDKSVDIHNEKLIKNYLKVYHFTDYYLVSSNIMKQIFIRSLDAKESQMLPFGLPRLDHYKNIKPVNHNKKIALYLPTYRDYTNQIHTINKEEFERACPEFELITKLHPSISNHMSDDRNTQDLIEVADLIITDYSSLSIEASLLDKTIIFYSFDEEIYNQKRGLNQYYYEMTETNKAYDVQTLYQLVNHNKINENIKQMWHEYTNFNATEQLIKFIKEGDCKDES
ncbi:CDP-glycerol glycerophosphotransferase family protein [Mammaliicoccus stepanovicii]|uniref:Teichoic acid biosynthesis protein B n=1 Tax=Mammaliicoccus stepanovicii TaxID=643214 RepID=A0A239ZRV3_9STAP|nr:CDP-glycerol glycerophosphotransferase family protein [Mammaliicoccus stepanovicii]GGI43434.1 teichoic acid biosynthesis protein B [Mammaliicoccus stepanovicii]SNV73503.1 teichoic acid biosynthesis protein B [Mammaliicoccus stepanovicii]